MTNFSGLFDGIHGETYSIPFTHSSAQRKLGYHLMKARLSNRDINELLDTLIGATAGSAASDSYTRVAPATEELARGGVREIETISVISRNSAAADVTALKALLRPTRTQAFLSSSDGSSPIGNPGYV